MLAVGVEVAILVVMIGLDDWVHLVLLGDRCLRFSFRSGVGHRRLGLRSGTLVPSLVGWSCRDFFI